MAFEMPDQLEHTSSAPKVPGTTSHSECIALLQSLQNIDGGWGFHAGEQSRVEPSCWAVRALCNFDQPVDSEVIRNAATYLRTAQLADGSWPASSQMSTGSWITSLACAVLKHDAQSANNVGAGLKWLCEDFPRDSSAFRRFLGKLRPQSHLSEQNNSYRGWGWTPRTASWVEPTAFALMALREAAPQQLPVNASQRRDLAISLLYDRMCPGGGWNCGNPRVYGVDGEALVLPTCWALLALKDESEKPGRALSLNWLQKRFAKIESAGSLAVAQMTLENYAIRPLRARHDLKDWAAEELAEQGTHVLAWVCVALDPARCWAAPAASLKESAEGRTQ